MQLHPGMPGGIAAIGRVEPHISHTWFDAAFRKVPVYNACAAARRGGKQLVKAWKKDGMVE